VYHKSNPKFRETIDKDLNYMKQDFSDEEFIEYCRKVAEKNPRGR
jgi:hypothetical protein